MSVFESEVLLSVGGIKVLVLVAGVSFSDLISSVPSDETFNFATGESTGSLKSALNPGLDSMKEAAASV